MLTQNPLFRRYLSACAPPLGLVLLIVVFQTAGLEESLRYDRQAVSGGEVWRLLTGNLVHLGWSHLWLNAAGLVLIYLLFGPLLSTRLWILHGILISLGVGLGLLWLNPELRWYVGLSGSLHGLFAVGVLTEGQRDRRFASLVFAIFAVKLIWEQVYGPLPGSEQSAGGPVVVDAHLYGAIAGVLTYTGFRIIQVIVATRR